MSKRESKKNLKVIRYVCFKQYNIKIMIYVCFKQYNMILKYDKSFRVVSKVK
jgi:hypothetical protein